jgi:hypothetical protein
MYLLNLIKIKFFKKKYEHTFFVCRGRDIIWEEGPAALERKSKSIYNVAYANGICWNLLGIISTYNTVYGTFDSQTL